MGRRERAGKNCLLPVLASQQKYWEGCRIPEAHREGEGSLACPRAANKAVRLSLLGSGEGLA